MLLTMGEVLGVALLVNHGWLEAARGSDSDEDETAPTIFLIGTWLTPAQHHFFLVEQDTNTF